MASCWFVNNRHGDKPAIDPCSRPVFAAGKQQPIDLVKNSQLISLLAGHWGKAPATEVASGERFAGVGQ